MLGRFKSLYIIVLAALLMLISQCVMAENEFLIKYAVPDRAGKILVLGGESSNEITYKIAKLNDPNRVVVDINNAILLESKKDIQLNNKSYFQSVRLAQFSTKPNIVRIVFEVKTPEDIEKVKINTYRNSLVFEFGEIELAKLKSPAVYKSKNEKVEVIEDDNQQAESNEIKEINLNNDNKENKDNLANPVKINETESKDDKVINKNQILKEIKQSNEHNITINKVELNNKRLIINGAGVISVTEPFVLDSPTRIIYDLTNAVLASKDLIKTFSLTETEKIRIGQFDNTTVRVVIETEKPNSFVSVISPDLQSIIISPSENLKFEEFPDNLSLGDIQKISVVKENENTTKVILVSEKPIIHNIKRLYSPDRALIELYNINKPNESVFEDIEKTGQFHGFVVNNLSNYQSGSEWSIQLNRTTQLETKLSLDGRVLEIRLQDSLAIAGAGLGPIRKKILLDPGHGGYDPGANREGIFEKDIALDVAKRVKKYLDSHGFYTMLTRSNDSTVSLKDRVDIINRENPDLFVSIHVNAAQNPDIKGIETHWYTPQSRSLAMHLQDKMVNQLVTPDRGIKNSRFYVIRKTDIPSVLAEIGYISNSIERYQLITEERKEATAKSIAEGILSYMKSRTPNKSNDGKNKL